MPISRSPLMSGSRPAKKCPAYRRTAAARSRRYLSLGTNDFEKNITADYTGWLTAVRQACPSARVFCVVPPLQLHRQEIQAAVESRNRAHDSRIYVIETARLAPGFRAGQGATQLGYDGVHPSQYGHALLAAVIGDQVRAILDREH
jgi:lysophospholipase L1-like esterase